jgi:hypothetical protein
VYDFGTLFKNPVGAPAWLTVPLVYVSFLLLLFQNQAVFVSMALKHSLMSGIVVSPALLFLVRIALAIQGLLCFHVSFEIACSAIQVLTGPHSA